MAAFAEWEAAQVKRAETFVYVTISTGISCSIIHNGSYFFDTIESKTEFKAPSPFGKRTFCCLIWEHLFCEEELINKRGYLEYSERYAKNKCDEWFKKEYDPPTGLHNQLAEDSCDDWVEGERRPRNDPGC